MSTFNLNVVQILLAGGLVQGMIFSVLLFFKKENKTANSFLSLFIISLLMAIFQFIAEEMQFAQNATAVLDLPFFFRYSFGPLFYFYVKSLTQSSFRFKTRQWLHFAPLVFDIFHIGYHLAGFQQEGWHRFAIVMSNLAVVPALIYFIRALKLVLAYQKNIRTRFSNLEKITLRWLQFLIAGFGLIALLWLAAGMSESWFDYELTYQNLYPIYILLVTIIYWISFRVWQQVEIPKEESNLTVDQSEVKDYQLLVEKLKNTMLTQQPYLDPNLTLQKLAEIVGIAPKLLSQVLNTGMGKKFYTFVNAYRLEAIKSKMLDDKLSHLTLLGLAFESGFNSKATFNRVFKELEGVSPNTYKKNIITPKLGLNSFHETPKR